MFLASSPIYGTVRIYDGVNIPRVRVPQSEVTSRENVQNEDALIGIKQVQSDGEEETESANSRCITGGTKIG